MDLVSRRKRSPRYREPGASAAAAGGPGRRRERCSARATAVTARGRVPSLLRVYMALRPLLARALRRRAERAPVGLPCGMRDLSS